ncbi:MAG: hypothetical protein KC713_07830, partial [Candidatus Omnitrophica bacterium]|nr:hypothetical protein [Candidatus Omnitrophota bacterium]
MHKFLDSYFQIIRKFLPEKGVEPSIGIDIGLEECKYVVLERENEEFVLVQCGTQSIDQGNVSGALRTVLDKINLPSSPVFTSISGKGTLIRYIDMPRMSLEDLKNS